MPFSPGESPRCTHLPAPIRRRCALAVRWLHIMGGGGMGWFDVGGVPNSRLLTKGSHFFSASRSHGQHPNQFAVLPEMALNQNWLKKELR